MQRNSDQLKAADELKLSFFLILMILADWFKFVSNQKLVVLIKKKTEVNKLR